MDIFKPFLGQGKVSVTYRDGTTNKVEISTTGTGEAGSPYLVTPRHSPVQDLFGLGNYYHANGDCYCKGDADIVSIGGDEQTTDPFNSFAGKNIMEDHPSFRNQNGENFAEVDHQYKDVLKGLAEILVAASPDDDPSDLVEEIKEHMNTHCREIMDEVQCKQDNEVEQLREQIKRLDSAAYDKLLEQLHLSRI